MITKKLMHDIQTWLNSLYNFNNSNYYKNKHIITNLKNFAFRFISVNISIWSLRIDGSLLTAIKSYSINIRSEEDFKTFKNQVDSDIDKYIKVAVEKSLCYPFNEYI